MAEGFSFHEDLEREIFETVAIAYPMLIPALLLVCHRVHVWIRPFLFAALSMDTVPVIEAVANALKSTPAIFLQQRVRHLYVLNFFSGRKGRETIIQLLGAISNIDNLIINRYSATDVALQRSLRDVRVKRLGLVLTWDLGYYVDLPPASFASITHLIIYRESSNPQLDPWPEWAHLASLPALTHLCLSENITRAILSQVLTQCTRLQAFVTIWIPNPWHNPAQVAETFLESFPITDARVILMPALDHKAEWELGASGRDDFWARADAFIARKHSGEISGSCYTIQEMLPVMHEDD
ncbi:hypothetical protein B0H11DRAFT_1954829 [Mycena galericulata]|nr:hypothetical protein B0H11DRAFT_1954829 [Mycena galericulata]